MDNSCKNWATAMNSQIDFYENSIRKTRVDNDLDWDWYYSIMTWRRKIRRYIKPLLNIIYRKKYTNLTFTKNWFNKMSGELWRARNMFYDDLSRKEFDSFLVLAICGFEKYYYSRLNFCDIITIIKEEEFTENLPKKYMGLPLKSFHIKIEDSEISEIDIISAKQEIDVTNNYRRYFMRRDGVDFKPLKDDVIFDCGSCIGEISAILASFVGKSGKVYTFDPVPLHNKYTELQIRKNPILNNVITINQLAVSDKSNKFTGDKTDVDSISPGGFSVDNYEAVSIDAFIKCNNIDRLDYIKMDIEGAELEALVGATESIKKFQPKLAISCYHKDSHLWEIPDLILKINPSYKIYFEQHLPIDCDALIYATI